MSASERLQRYLARCGVASRRACEEIITAGRVDVNGKRVTQLGVKVDPRQDRVSVDGRLVSPEERLVYIALHKPRGVLTSVSDRFGRQVVTDLIPDVPERVFPVGRLDMDSEGLLILTNDGKLAFRLMHPRYHVAKTYLVTVSGTPSEASLERLRSGVVLEDGITHPAQVEQFKSGPGQKPGDGAQYSQWLVTIHEGRKRQVRRMFDAIGHPVHRLVRVGFGPVSLGNLSSGSYRYLGSDEIEKLRREVGLDS